MTADTWYWCGCVAGLVAGWIFPKPWESSFAKKSKKASLIKIGEVWIDPKDVKTVHRDPFFGALVATSTGEWAAGRMEEGWNRKEVSEVMAFVDEVAAKIREANGDEN